MIQIISIFLSSIVIILGWIVHRKTERLKILENQLSEKKYKAYSDMVGLFYSMLKDVKNNKKSDLKSIGELLTDSKRDILMYGSDEVFHKFNDYLCYSKQTIEDKDNSIILKYFLEFILEIRKDMQGGKTNLTEYDILLNLMQDKDAVYQFMKKINF